MRNKLHDNAKCSYLKCLDLDTGWIWQNKFTIDMSKRGKMDSFSSNEDLVLILFTKKKKVLGAPPTAKYPYFTSLLERGRV